MDVVHIEYHHLLVRRVVKGPLLGGIFHVRELFSRFVGPVIDKVLGLRCTSFGYQYGEIAG